MATREQYKKGGYSDSQIDVAIANKNAGNAPLDVVPAATPYQTPNLAPTTPTPTSQAPATQAPAPVTREQAYQNAVDVSKRTDANGVTSEAGAVTETWNPNTGKYESPSEAIASRMQAQAREIQPATEAQKAPEAPAAPAPAEQPPAQLPVTVEQAAAAKREPAKAPETAKPQEYFDQSQKREQEILTNLNEGFKNDPSLFRDENTFKASYGYDTADEGKKKMLDAFWQSKQPKGESQFADVLLSG